MGHHDICLLHCERKEGKKERNKEAPKALKKDALKEALTIGYGKEPRKHGQQENGQ